MKAFVYTTCVILAGFFSSCEKGAMYEQKLRAIDSLSGAVNAVVNQLEKIDTIALQKSVARFTWYKQFIEQDINDTLSREEADKLQQFYSSGRNLENFSVNRKLILVRGSLINAQLARLGDDASTRKASVEQISLFYNHEKAEATKLIEQGYRQQQLFHSSLQEFKNALNGVESLIRSRNKGELPTIVKDTVNL